MQGPLRELLHVPGAEIARERHAAALWRLEGEQLGELGEEVPDQHNVLGDDRAVPGVDAFPDA